MTFSRGKLCMKRSKEWVRGSICNQVTLEQNCEGGGAENHTGVLKWAAQCEVGLCQVCGKRHGGWCVWSTKSEGDIGGVSEVKSCRALHVVSLPPPCCLTWPLPSSGEFALISICTVQLGTQFSATWTFPWRFCGFWSPLSCELSKGRGDIRGSFLHFPRTNWCGFP